jgi:hypothetical protein
LSGHDETLSRLQIVADEIAQVHGARVDKTRMDNGMWVASIEHEDKGSVIGSGVTEVAAFGDLIKNAKAEGWA